MNKSIFLPRSGEGYKGPLINFDNVSIYCNALCLYFFTNRKNKYKCIIGYDKREHCRHLAKEFMDVLYNLGIDITFIDGSISSPVFSYNMRNKKYIFGLYFSASHRPESWYGLKIKISNGYRTPHYIYDKIDQLYLKELKYTSKSIGLLNKVDSQILLLNYANLLKNYLKKLNIKDKNPFGLLDNNFSSTEDIKGILDFLEIPYKIYYLNKDVNKKNFLSSFSIVENYNIEYSKEDLIVGFDPDGDNFSILLPDNYLSSSFASLIYTFYLIKYSTYTGHIFLEFGMPKCIKKMYDIFNKKIFWVDGRFYDIQNNLIKNKGLLGADENGNIASPLSFYNRDGLLASLISYYIKINEKKMYYYLINHLLNCYNGKRYLRATINCNKINLLKIADKISEIIGEKYLIRPVTKTIEFLFDSNNEYWILVRKSSIQNAIHLRGEVPHIIFKKLHNNILKK